TPSSWVEITYPADGQTVSGRRVTITASASEDIDTVQFYIDGVLRRTDSYAPFSYRWDTTRYSNGEHTIMVKGYDGGVFKADDSITVTVANYSIALLSWLVLFLPIGIIYRRR
ncbi:MAG: Ig-like domain-containing protein, partial [Theionarchaea archaeon]|nr:Ig-like domain-containing protein [Theionarchaea archaeon]